ncbi:hypothetical protein D3C80_1626790 [compost metagenome]
MRRIGSAIRPPPQPMSIRLRPANGARVRMSRSKCAAARSRTNFSRAGLKRCRGANGPFGSHHSAAWAEKRATSAGSMLGPSARSVAKGEKPSSLWGLRGSRLSLEADMAAGMNRLGRPCKQGTKRHDDAARNDTTGDEVRGDLHGGPRAYSSCGANYRRRGRQGQTDRRGGVRHGRQDQ